MREVLSVSLVGSRVKVWRCVNRCDFVLWLHLNEKCAIIEVKLHHCISMWSVRDVVC